jgi:hypothetical protein
MTGPLIIATVPSPRGLGLRISLDRLDGAAIVDLRQTSPISRTCGVHSPTKTGIAICVEDIPTLIRALEKAHHAAREAGLIGGDA